MSEVKITDETTTIPDSVKKPQDRKVKVNKDGTKTVTVHGQDYTIEADALDDFELLDDLAGLDDGELYRLPRVLRRLLGKESYKIALESVRDAETGRVSVEAGSELVQDLIKELAPNS